MRSTILKLIRLVIPRRLYVFIRSTYRTFRGRRIYQKFEAANRLTIQSGPFRGTRYTDRGSFASHLPQLIGCYEEELHATIEEIVLTAYPVVIDVGSAEGYYAVGLARKMTNTQVHAFDIDSNARLLCEEMATLNGVSNRVHIHGLATYETIGDLIESRSLLLCDCEGFERELLDPEKIKNLWQVDILVEVHDFIHPGISEILSERFSTTHSIVWIAATKRDGGSHASILPFLSQGDLSFACNEFRPPGMRWAWMKSRSA